MTGPQKGASAGGEWAGALAGSDSDMLLAANGGRRRVYNSTGVRFCQGGTRFTAYTQGEVNYGKWTEMQRQKVRREHGSAELGFLCLGYQASLPSEGITARLSR